MQKACCNRRFSNECIVKKEGVTVTVSISVGLGPGYIHVAARWFQTPHAQEFQRQPWSFSRSILNGRSSVFVCDKKGARDRKTH